MIDKLKEKLGDIAKQESCYDTDDFDVMGICGGNYDDAIDAGYDAGRIGLARTLLKFMEEG